MPFFTIITATYNATATLPRLLDSLAGQSCRDFELILQDGASTDNTVAIAEAYRERLPALSLVSEPDTGIYDAWNRALPRIRGEWVLFLGADDQLAAPDVLERCRTLLASFPDSALYAGGSIERVSNDGEIFDRVSYCPDKYKDKSLWRAMPFPHPGLWHRQRIFNDTKFDASLRIAADYDFVCRTWNWDNGYSTLPFTVTFMQRGGISDSPESVLRMRWEDAVISTRYCTNVWTFPCIIGLCKGAITRILCAALGKKAPILLDMVRKFRGLPSVWSAKCRD